MIRGSCLCGGVAFEIEGRLSPIQCCHATRCRKSTGAAFAPEVATRKRSFRWVRGEELVTLYEAPLLREPPPFRKAFCSVCGSPLPVVEQDNDFVAFLAGVLDGDPETTAVPACLSESEGTLVLCRGRAHQVRRETAGSPEASAKTGKLARQSQEVVVPRR